MLRKKKKKNQIQIISIFISCWQQDHHCHPLLFLFFPRLQDQHHHLLLSLSRLTKQSPSSFLSLAGPITTVAICSLLAFFFFSLYLLIFSSCILFDLDREGSMLLFYLILTRAKELCSQHLAMSMLVLFLFFIFFIFFFVAAFMVMCLLFQWHVNCV